MSHYGSSSTYEPKITYSAMQNGTCQYYNFIYFLECNWCSILYVGQPRNRIIDRFLNHIFYIKQTSNTTVARPFASHSNCLDPRMTLHILEYIMLPKKTPRSHSIRDKKELVAIHRPNTLIPNGLNILD